MALPCYTINAIRHYSTIVGAQNAKKEVVWEDTVKGLKGAKGYIVLTKEQIAQLRPEKSEKIRIVEFIDADQLEPIYLNHQYYVAPAKENDLDSFVLFMTALHKLNKVAIGRFVMRDKEYVCALRAYEKYLLLTTLHYLYEIKNIDAIALHTSVKPQAGELKLAQELINKLSVKKLDMSKFKDTFALQVKALLKKKAGKSEKAIVEKAPKKVAHKRESLMESLRASLERPEARV